MSRRRYISTDISLDTAVDEVAHESDFAALLYTWMIPHADDYAALKGSPAVVLAQVIPHRRDKTVADVREALRIIARHSLIEWDEAESMIYFDPDSFYRYQTYIKADKQRVSRENAAKRRQSAQNAASLSLSPSLKDNAFLSQVATEPVDNSADVDKSVENLCPSIKDEDLDESVRGYWSDKIGREPTDAESSSLRSLLLHHPPSTVCEAIGQAMVQGHPPTNFGIITTIAKAMT